MAVEYVLTGLVPTQPTAEQVQQAGDGAPAYCVPITRGPSTVYAILTAHASILATDQIQSVEARPADSMALLATPQGPYLMAGDPKDQQQVFAVGLLIQTRAPIATLVGVRGVLPTPADRDIIPRLVTALGVIRDPGVAMRIVTADTRPRP